MTVTDKVVAVVQARMGATRLPNKMMLWLNGYPVIEWVRRRLSFCTKLDEIVFAVPFTDENRVLADYLASKMQWVYIGPEDDVLTRVANAANRFQADIVVRVCGDNPFVSAEAIDPLASAALAEHEAENAGNVHYGALYHYYLSTQGVNGWPDGLGAEAVRADTIYAAWRESGEREHILDWIKYDEYRVVKIDSCPSELVHPELKLDLDTYEDYQRLLASGVEIDMTAVEIVECFL